MLGGGFYRLERWTPRVTSGLQCEPVSVKRRERGGLLGVVSCCGEPRKTAGASG
jgi:hypothetical protein